MCSKLNLESSVFIIILDMTSRRIMFAVYKQQSTIGLALRELKLNQEILGGECQGAMPQTGSSNMTLTWGVQINEQMV